MEGRTTESLENQQTLYFVQNHIVTDWNSIFETVMKRKLQIMSIIKYIDWGLLGFSTYTGQVVCMVSTKIKTSIHRPLSCSALWAILSPFWTFSYSTLSLETISNLVPPITGLSVPLNLAWPRESCWYLCRPEKQHTSQVNITLLRSAEALLTSATSPSSLFFRIPPDSKCFI